MEILDKLRNVYTLILIFLLYVASVFSTIWLFHNASDRVWNNYVLFRVIIFFVLLGTGIYVALEWDT